MDEAGRHTERERDLAGRVRDAAVTCVLAAYEEAGIRGLCGDGRFEMAVDVLRNLDVEAVLREMDRSAAADE